MGFQELSVWGDCRGKAAEWMDGMEIARRLDVKETRARVVSKWSKNMSRRKKSRNMRNEKMWWMCFVEDVYCRTVADPVGAEELKMAKFPPKVPS